MYSLEVADEGIELCSVGSIDFLEIGVGSVEFGGIGVFDLEGVQSCRLEVDDVANEFQHTLPDIEPLVGEELIDDALGGVGFVEFVQHLDGPICIICICMW